MDTPGYIQTAAAVVQAIGSVWAIRAATNIASRQADRDQQARRQNLCDRVGVVEVMIAGAARAAQEYWNHVNMLPMVGRVKVPNPVQVTNVRVAMNIVSVIRPEQAPTAETARAILMAQTAVSDSVGYIFLDGHGFEEDWSPRLVALRDTLGRAAELMTTELLRVKGAE
ncbi:hypothetical protein [Paraburkholderia solisilvae]|nr:hypothetical protein [Paraburkholderia solisilvae]